MDKMATQFRNALVYDSLPSLLTFLAILGAAYAWHQNDRSTRLEAQLSQAELQALRAQLQPHFLFNTLNSISVLLEEDPKAANQMLLHLSDLLRVMTQRTGSPEISLREELDLIRTYLEIEQTRFRDRLTVRFENDPAALDARIPSLLLQPLVENAVRHGVAPRSTPGLIHISTHRNNGSVRILIRDNGPGIPADNSARPGHGVGLSNTRARLELLYGKDHRFTLENAPGGGLESLIEIPYRS
jgi:sensor histidine kinase YesM